MIDHDHPHPALRLLGLAAAGVSGAPSVNWVATVHSIRTTWSGSL